MAADFLNLRLSPKELNAAIRADPLDVLVEALRHVYPEADATWVNHFFTVWADHLHALHRYQPRKRYPGALIYFKAVSPSPQAVFGPYDASCFDQAWASLSAQPLQVYETQGDHFSIVRAPYVDDVAAKLSRCIEAAVVHESVTS
jgi:hypothetical protein